MQSSTHTEINVPFDMACQFVAHTSQSVFVTGKAGTGKTTFLKQLREHTHKKLAVAAPTGVAAINAGGVTLHSLFQLPFKPFLPTVSQHSFRDEHNFCDQKSLFAGSHLSASKIEVIKELEVLVIDEVSMVRADLLDAIDTLLRHYRGNEHPFGGLQMVFIGDLYQLPPVVRNEEWSVMQLYYDSPFFFESHALKNLQPLVIELQKIYRQKEGLFLDILNRIRTNSAGNEDLDHLNTYFKPSFRPSAGDAYITLTTHNDKAETINKYQLGQLKSGQKTYRATITGEFNEKNSPAEVNLHLKVNAQVLFIKNDKGEQRRYYNGMLAIVSDLHDDYIMVKPVSGEAEMKVEKETWKNIRYNANKETDSIEEEELGSFIQYPLRLAWAITIHKSQGLTFDRAIVDAGDSFAAGQVYVALSRLTSTEQLVLYSKITRHSIQVDERILRYLEVVKPVEFLTKQLKQQQQKYLASSLKKAFQFDELVNESFDQWTASGERQIPDKEQSAELLKKIYTQLSDLQKVGIKFIQELDRILPSVDTQGYAQLQKRVNDAVGYFLGRIKNEAFDPLTAHVKEMTPKKKTKKYVKELSLMISILKRQKVKLEQAKVYADGLHAGTDVQELLRDRIKPAAEEPAMADEAPLKGEKPKKGESHRISLEMFKEGKSVSEIAKERGYALTTIEGHLCSFIPTGEILIGEIVAEETIKKITAVIDRVGLLSSKTIKEELEDSITYGQIRAVMEQYKMDHSVMK